MSKTYKPVISKRRASARQRHQALALASVRRQVKAARRRARARSPYAAIFSCLVRRVPCAPKAGRSPTRSAQRRVIMSRARRRDRFSRSRLRACLPASAAARPATSRAHLPTRRPPTTRAPRAFPWRARHAAPSSSGRTRAAAAPMFALLLSPASPSIADFSPRRKRTRAARAGRARAPPRPRAARCAGDISISSAAVSSPWYFLPLYSSSSGHLEVSSFRHPFKLMSSFKLISMSSSCPMSFLSGRENTAPAFHALKTSRTPALPHQRCAAFL